MKIWRIATISVALSLTVLAAALVVTPLGAHDYQAGEIKIDHPWARPTIGNVKNAAAYLVLENNGKASDRLIGVASDIAARTEIHETTVTDGYAKMAAVPNGFEVGANSVVKLEPRGKHIMLFGVTQKLEDGQSFPLTLKFEKAGEVKVVVKIEKAKAEDKADDHSKHSGHSKHGGEHGDKSDGKIQGHGHH
ncbi:MAG: copper chaperone PCu(A)C [Hyphomicrobiaceae bacterium]